MWLVPGTSYGLYHGLTAKAGFRSSYGEGMHLYKMFEELDCIA